MAQLIRNRHRIDGNGNYIDRFSDWIGKPLVNKMWAAGWLEQTGWYLSGRPCLRIKDGRVKDVRSASKSAAQKEPKYGL